MEQKPKIDPKRLLVKDKDSYQAFVFIIIAGVIVFFLGGRIVGPGLILGASLSRTYFLFSNRRALRTARQSPILKD